MQTQRGSLSRVFTVCYSICIFLTEYSKVWPLCLNFKLITATFSGVQKFMNFTVCLQLSMDCSNNYRLVSNMNILSLKLPDLFISSFIIFTFNLKFPNSILS